MVGEALLEQAHPLAPTPDTGAARSDLEQLLVEGAALVRTPPVRALFEVLLAGSTDPSSNIARARDRFWVAHLDEVRAIVDRAVARSELPANTDPAAILELLIGPALVRSLLMDRELRTEDISEIVARALAVPRPGVGPSKADETVGKRPPPR